MLMNGQRLSHTIILPVQLPHIPTFSYNSHQTDIDSNISNCYYKTHTFLLRLFLLHRTHPYLNFLLFQFPNHFGKHYHY